MDLTKRAVKEALGINTDAELARVFGINRWAVGQWPEDQLIPEGRQWQLRALYPDVFPLGGDPEARRIPAANEGDAAGDSSDLKAA